ncbi:Altronate dehydratase [Gloeomargarita lithophora Alchichica-D10]|uniref:Altronate dehydratase n=2 Tax=Gloeomargarita TaxID=1188227 RepID=A0A1J0ADH0_9CYAN|nr:Altronate dehydratase [Gloeomargarita lithophora Alchichica-D10]
MDSNKLIFLKVDLEAQMNDIERIHQKLLDRVAKLQVDDEVILESIAYQIHNLFCAIEDLLKIVASCFENNVSSSNQWHTLLLQRMSKDIPGIRPALLSSNTYAILNNLRGFRHFFRHAYGTTIEYEQLKINLDKALKLKENLDADIHHFLLRLSDEIN